jgi:hypothetical protein
MIPDWNSESNKQQAGHKFYFYRVSLTAGRVHAYRSFA